MLGAEINYRIPSRAGGKKHGGCFGMKGRNVQGRWGDMDSYLGRCVRWSRIRLQIVKGALPQIWVKGEWDRQVFRKCGKCQKGFFSPAGLGNW